MPTRVCAYVLPQDRVFPAIRRRAAAVKPSAGAGPSSLRSTVVARFGFGELVERLIDPHEAPLLGVSVRHV